MQCISVKQGPFLGQEFDKVIVKVKNDPGIWTWNIKVDKNALIKALDKGEISGTFGKSITDLEETLQNV